jgi:hypothetical protein
MLGSAGIGWAHLRAADPASLPAGWTPRIVAPSSADAAA